MPSTDTRRFKIDGLPDIVRHGDSSQRRRLLPADHRDHATWEHRESQPPAAFAARGLTGFRIIDCLFGALAQIRPDRVPAACEGGNTGVSIGGWDRSQGPFIFVEFVCGTGGGRPGLDGVDGHANPGVCMCNVPCGVVEVESPVVIDCYGFAPDTGGAGKFRGGLALVRDFRFVGEEAILQVRSDRRAHLPYGLAGGRAPGTPSANVLNPASARSAGAAQQVHHDHPLGRCAAPTSSRAGAATATPSRLGTVQV